MCCKLCILKKNVGFSPKKVLQNCIIIPIFEQETFISQSIILIEKDERR
jgi:hypothetical protein